MPYHDLAGHVKCSCIRKRTDVISLSVNIGKKPGGEVAFAGGGNNGDDGFVLIFRALSHLQGSPNDGTTGDADGDAVQSVDLLGYGTGIGLVDLDNLVHDRGVQVYGNKAGPNAL